MDMLPDPNHLASQTQYEQLLERLQPESDIEDRLVRHIVLCSVKLEHIEKLLANAAGQFQQVLESPHDEPSP